MSKHLKIFVSVLFIVIIILAICITRFYFDVSKDTGNNIAVPVIYSQTEQNVNGLYAFESENNLFGVVDEEKNLILEPQWQSVEVLENGLFIVSDNFKGKILYGCVDSDGNTKVPFIYSEIDNVYADDTVFYVGRVADDGSCIVYDDNFNPCFSRVWDGCNIDGNKLTLYYNDNVYSYFVGSDGISLKSTEIRNSVDDVEYSVSFNSRVLLSKLDYKSLEKISDCLSSYLSYSMTGDYSYLVDCVSADNRSNFRTFFSEYSNVFYKKITSVKDISVYSKKDEDGKQYIIASATVGADVSYMDDETGIALKDNYHAVIKFDEKAFDIDMVSAEFSDDEIKSDISEEATTSDVQ